MQLKELKPGQQAILNQIKCDDPGLARRLEAMGFNHGQKIKLLRKAWLNGPMHIRVGMTTEVAMRRSEAEVLQLIPENEWEQTSQDG